jgi:putative membrane protein
MMGPGWGGGHDAGWWGMGLGLLAWILLLLVAEGLVVWLVNRNAPGTRAGRTDAAEEVLRHRFASGEIDADEYERRLALLRR